MTPRGQARRIALLEERVAKLEGEMPTINTPLGGECDGTPAWPGIQKECGMSVYTPEQLREWLVLHYAGMRRDHIDLPSLVSAHAAKIEECERLLNYALSMRGAIHHLGIEGGNLAEFDTEYPNEYALKETK